jgi:Ca2+-binding RTX toxin-like protein
MTDAIATYNSTELGFSEYNSEGIPVIRMTRPTSQMEAKISVGANGNDSDGSVFAGYLVDTAFAGIQSAVEAALDDLYHSNPPGWLKISFAKRTSLLGGWVSYELELKKQINNGETEYVARWVSGGNTIVGEIASTVGSALATGAAGLIVGTGIGVWTGAAIAFGGAMIASIVYEKVFENDVKSVLKSYASVTERDLEDARDSFEDLNSDQINPFPGNDGIGFVVKDTISENNYIYYKNNSGTNSFRIADIETIIEETGVGEDIIDYTGNSEAVNISLAAGNTYLSSNVKDGIPTGEAKDIFDKIEHAVGTDYNDTIEGSDEENELFGSEGNDELIAYGSNDVLDGGKGNDYLEASGNKTFMYGGSGEDTFALANGAFVMDANGEDHTKWGGHVLSGGVSQWWNEQGYAHYAGFGAVLAGAPITTAGLLGALGVLMDIPQAALFRYSFGESGQQLDKCQLIIRFRIVQKNVR